MTVDLLLDSRQLTADISSHVPACAIVIDENGDWDAYLAASALAAWRAIFRGEAKEARAIAERPHVLQYNRDTTSTTTPARSTFCLQLVEAARYLTIEEYALPRRLKICREQLCLAAESATTAGERDLEQLVAAISRGLAVVSALS